MLQTTLSPQVLGSGPLLTSGAAVKAARIAIIGAGNSARALAAYLASGGHKVSLVARDPGKIPTITNRLAVRASGKIEGLFPIHQVADHAGQVLPDVDIVFVATLTTAYKEVAENLAPYLRDHHKVVLFSGKLGGALLFARAVTEAGGPKITVLETDSLFACRAQDDESIWVRGLKRWTLYSGINRSTTRSEGETITRFFPDLEPASNIIERGLTDFGALAHAPVVLANMNAIDRQESFLFYYKGLTSKTVVILERIEEEFNLVAEAYGAKLIPMKDLLDRYYGCDPSSLHRAMQTVPNYRYSQSPPSLDHRFLIEDVSATLRPLQQFGRLAGVATPVVDSVVTLAGVLTGIDFSQCGRSLPDFGLQNMSYEAVYEALNA
jgi:opine dehydrogenase